jgi:hypothetical protein
MFKMLVETIRKTSVEEEGVRAPRTLARAELQDLFRDDFAAQAVMIRSRKAARNGQVRMAA